MGEGRSQDLSICISAFDPFPHITMQLNSSHATRSTLNMILVLSGFRDETDFLQGCTWKGCKSSTIYVECLCPMPESYTCQILMRVRGMTWQLCSGSSRGTMQTLSTRKLQVTAPQTNKANWLYVLRSMHCLTRVWTFSMSSRSTHYYSLLFRCKFPPPRAFDDGTVKPWPGITLKSSRSVMVSQSTLNSGGNVNSCSDEAFTYKIEAKDFTARLN